jgi:hypothetical protein
LQAKLEKFLMRVINFIKNWTLLCSLIAGTVVYLLFSEIPFLEPTGDFAGPILIELMPFIISTMLYITFCKMQIHDLRPRTWHFHLARDKNSSLRTYGYCYTICQRTGNQTHA